MSATETPLDPPADGGASADGPPPDDEATAPARPRPSGWAIGGWLVLAGIAVALDGPVGGLVFVFIAAVLLAGVSVRIIGAVGVLLLLAVPVAILAAGLPSEGDLSPAFVTRSLVPHHLTFSGLVLVSAYALIDLRPHLRAWAAGEHPVQDDGPPFGKVAGVVVVALVAVGALVASVAVLGT